MRDERGVLKYVKWVVWALVVVAIVIDLAPICFCWFVAVYGAYPPFLIYPSTRRIAKRYLTAVTASDVEAAVELAGPDEGCRNAMREMAERDIALFGNADVRKVWIGVGQSQGSREELEFANVQFEYRISADSEWRKGTIRVMTDYQSLFERRYACADYP